MSEIDNAVAQTLQAQQAGGTGQGAAVPPAVPSPGLTGQNGHADISPLDQPSRVVTLPSGVSWGKKCAWMDMPGEYAGMKVYVWVNYPNDFDTQISSRDNTLIRDACKRIFIEHNGWTSPEEVEAASRENRNPVPLSQPTTDEFWEQIPNELAGALILLLNRETMKLPKLLMEKNRI